MPILEHDGVFQMLVPDGWQASVDEHTYELVPPSNDGAVHISVFTRNPSAVSAEEAEELLGDLLDSMDAPEGTAARVLPDKGQCRAVARSTLEDDEGRRRDALAFIVVWETAVLGCTCLADVGSPLIDEAERMFASISPVGRRRGLFGRRK